MEIVCQSRMSSHSIKPGVMELILKVGRGKMRLVDSQGGGDRSAIVN